MGSTYGPCKKKSNQIRICANFSTGLNDALQDYHYPLPSPEENFNKLNIKNMQNLRGPLNELLKKDKPWLRTPECQEFFEKIKKTPEYQESFENIKKTLTSDLSLTHYDPTLDIIVASDASSYSIGACIFPKLPGGSRKAVAHVSKSLLPAEKQYSQIEKEALGIIFAVTKFHRYLHGRWFILQTDHKPLITILGSKKGLPVYTAKIKSVFDKLIPRQAKFKKTDSPHKKHFYSGDKVLFKAYKNNMTFWEVGTIKQKIGELVYIVQGPKKHPPTPYEPTQEIPFE